MEPGFFPSIAIFLLVALLFPELPSAQHTSFPSPEFYTEPWQPPAEQRYPLSERQENDYGILPRTPPFYEPEESFKVVNCKRNEGYCQEFCNYLETQIGYCSRKKDACCLRRN
ncbi:sperm-associated antigen 11B-like [Oryctolagus cuniculus]|uniref:sperm-associated antigen 11B-like n=1 Tax=Oryctolagus cuniculus TaxID=9986 RepID=UPI00387A3C71